MADVAENLWTAHPTHTLRAGTDFDLAAFDRNGTPGWAGDKRQAKAFMAQRGKLLSELQERLFADGRTGGDRSVLLVVQGLDTAGKGGIVRHVLGMVDPQGVSLRSFGVPTAEEKRHHYLWRIRRALPEAGRIGVFDRSHYEDVLVVRVEDLVDEDVWSGRFDEINRFEQKLADSGTTIIKVALMVSYEEQGLRLMERLDRPDKYWKFNPGDVDTRKSWDAYQAAYSDVFARTSTDVAPWHVIPADRKWYSRLAVTELLTKALVDLDLDWPRPRWKVETQKRRLAATMSEASVAEAEASAGQTLAEVRAAEAQFDAAVARAAALAQRPPAQTPAAASGDRPGPTDETVKDEVSTKDRADDADQTAAGDGRRQAQKRPKAKKSADGQKAKKGKDRRRSKKGEKAAKTKKGKKKASVGR
uniref:PPK2 family polyphosphate kinase n=1 Tax=Georgenia subflava TaxID=1622177 RepID=UPI00186B3738|nr:PPK2 family polyphosphate kinase [Georgenia subflava]